jgi:hypothetical protein
MGGSGGLLSVLWVLQVTVFPTGAAFRGLARVSKGTLSMRAQNSVWGSVGGYFWGLQVGTVLESRIDTKTGVNLGSVLGSEKGPKVVSKKHLPKMTVLQRC